MEESWPCILLYSFIQQWFNLNTDISILNTHNKAKPCCLFLSFFLFMKFILAEKKNRSSRPEVFIGKDVLKICSKCTGEHLCRSAISVMLLCNFTEIELWHGCSPVNLNHIFRTPFLKNTSGRLLQEKLSHISWVRTYNSQDWVTVKHLKELVMLILLWIFA